MTEQIDIKDVHKVTAEIAKVVVKYREQLVALIGEESNRDGYYNLSDRDVEFIDDLVKDLHSRVVQGIQVGDL